MKPSKRLAAGLAGVLAIAGVAVLSTGTSAIAFSGTQNVACHLYFGGGLPGSPAGDASLGLSNSTFIINSLTVDNPTPLAGQTVNVTLTSAAGLTNGPVALVAGALAPSAAIQLSGAQSGTVTLTSVGLYPTGAVATNSPIGPLTLTGSYVATGNGATNLAFKTLVTYDNSNSGANNFCDGTAGGTTAIPPSTNGNYPTNGTSYATTNFVLGVSGFRATRIAAGPTVTWDVPPTWSPYSGPIAPPSTAGYGDVFVAGAPATSATITQATTVTGPNAVITTSTGQNAGVQAVRKLSSAGAPVNTTTTLTGTVWPASVASGGFTTQFCNTLGASCDASAPTNTLATDGSGNLTGSITVGAGNPLTSGNRAIKVTSGASSALVPVQVLGTPVVTISPASGGAGTAVVVSGNNFNPNQTTTAYGSGLNTVPYTTTADAATTVTSGPTGLVTANFTVNVGTTQTILAYQGTPGVPSASNPSGLTTFAFNADRCVAYTSNLTGGLGCSTNQNVQVSVTAGRLLQRAYLDAAITSGSINGITPNANSAPTQINLGTITTPLAPATIGGRMNPITVTDNRGGVYGWSLTATMTTLTGVAVNTNTIGNGQLTGSPTCAPAINAEAWDYTAIGQTAIAGFDDTLNAPGVTAGGAAQPFSGTVTLCTKNTTTNALTDSTGGVYNVTSPLTLVVPAFQAADTYNAVMTITLV